MLSIREENGITVIGFEPMYDSLDDDAMARTQRDVLEAAQQRAPLVLCDFSQTKYFGSALIEILARAWQRLRARGGHMVLCGLQPFCHKVLTVSNLDEVWEFFDSQEEAIASLRAQG